MSEEDLKTISEMTCENAFITHALIELLIKKGIITDKEFCDEVAKVKMESECSDNEKIN